MRRCTPNNNNGRSITRARLDSWPPNKCAHVITQASPAAVAAAHVATRSLLSFAFIQDAEYYYCAGILPFAGNAREFIARPASNLAPEGAAFSAQIGLAIVRRSASPFFFFSYLCARGESRVVWGPGWTCDSRGWGYGFSELIHN